MRMNDDQAMAAYLRSDPHWSRIMDKILNKYIGQGGCKGSIVIQDATSGECAAATGLLRSVHPFEPPVLKFRLSEFEAAMQRTKYSQVTLKGVLEAYFRRQIHTKREQKIDQNDNQEQFFREITESISDVQLLRWLCAMQEEKKYGYILLMKQFQTTPDAASAMLKQVCRAIELLQDGKPIPIARLSAEVTGNAHAFDRTEPTGRLLIEALAFLAGSTDYQNAEEINAIYTAFSIEPDLLSGAAAAVGIRLYDGTAHEHPGYRYFADTGEIFMISMAALERIRSADAGHKTVFVVENPTVFYLLAPAAAEYGVGLLCTFGQLKASGLRILDLLAENRCRIYYAGDYDPEGLMIADKILCRYSGYVASVWCMDVACYRKIEKAETLTERRLHLLQNICSVELISLAEELKQEKRSAHQELLIAEMKEEMKRLSAVSEMQPAI